MRFKKFDESFVCLECYLIIVEHIEQKRCQPTKHLDPSVPKEYLVDTKPTDKEVLKEINEIID